MDKAKLLELLGPFPNKIELRPKIIQRVEKDKYFLETVEYLVEEDELIRAFILIPKNIRQPVPAIFCHHQHAGQYTLGKSEVVGLEGDPNQAIAHELAELGYVTFAPDAICFEERNRGKDLLASEYFELSNRLVQGKTLTAKVLHDLFIGIDYLISRPEVDPQRIGFMGHSYGGRMALWAPALDKRIKVSISSCGCINFKESLAIAAGIQMAFCVPHILEHGDLNDIVRMIEPCSLLILAGNNDKWSEGAESLFLDSRSTFIQGIIELKMHSGGHRLSSEMRKQAYQFIKNHL